MNIFDLRDTTIADYRDFIRGFVNIRDARVRQEVDRALDEGRLWPEPWLSLNPKFEPGGTIGDLVRTGVLHAECDRIFRLKGDVGIVAQELNLYRHQVRAIEAARSGDPYVLSTGTGSGKSLAYIVPIVDRILRQGPGQGIKAIIVYPMNALANSQFEELSKFINRGYPDERGPVRFKRYTGQESDEEREAIIANPPDILLTNYVMLELILTRSIETKGIVPKARGLQFLVLDELHTYRGRQGGDVSLLVRRLRAATESPGLQCIGTSATLASEGSLAEQRRDIAKVASRLFGADVSPDRVIGETLERSTDPVAGEGGFAEALAAAVRSPNSYHEADFAQFSVDPLARWLEQTIGLTSKDGELVRAEPRQIDGAGGIARELSQEIGVELDDTVTAIRSALLSGASVIDPSTNRPVFAFRLHQFISRGSNVFATPEAEADRHVTLVEQQYVPGDRSRRLLPLSFCRQCGQDYYLVEHVIGEDGESLTPRDLGDSDTEQGERRIGFLYLSTENPWPFGDEEEIFSRIPPDWLEELASGKVQVQRSQRQRMPEQIWVSPNARVTSHSSGAAQPGAFVPINLRFCLHCGVTYAPTSRSDIGKLSTLGFEGRSTSTTMLVLSVLRHLADQRGEDQVPRKLLDFTDNRQDASLQAGHFNDFVQVSLLRSGLYRALDAAGDHGITYTDLAERVFESLGLPLVEYAQNPDARRAAKDEIDRAFREVLAYRLYGDLQAGWRFTSPNLEQVGLLQVDYPFLDELCADESEWTGCHEALAEASPAERDDLCRAILDWLRHELAIQIDPLNAAYHEQLWLRSNNNLIAPWAIDENERYDMTVGAVAWLSGRSHDDQRNWLFITPRTAVGQHIGRRAFPGRHLRAAEVEDVLAQLFKRLTDNGLLKGVDERSLDNTPLIGYQIPASAIVWKVGDGTSPARDLIRVPRAPKEQVAVNEFFVEFYRTVADSLIALEAREHTAQVPSEERQRREDAFRDNKLPVLFCSPTMELGIDISSLNVVGMRNVPPTPANYAQRSGRAGRSGQPALVFTYCSTGSAHDQYFFRRPTLMVSGKIRPPSIDLANEDLVRSHVHAIWLAETGVSLGRSLKNVLDLSGDPARLTLQDSLADDIARPRVAERTRIRATEVLATIADDLAASEWWSETWLDAAVAGAALRFDQAADRWRDLYRAADSQQRVQNAVRRDHTKSADEKRRAERLRHEAEQQVELLLNEARTDFQSDFYSYRYFASEGFLPGYNFPRLPISAFIPARRRGIAVEDWLSRPRFVAIQEFGPQALIYHEGSVYRVNKVMIPMTEGTGPNAEDPVVTSTRVQCTECGYLHPAPAGVGPDLCERCGSLLEDAGQQFPNMFRMTSVTARRHDRINSNLEERQRRGYELRTGFTWAEIGGRPMVRHADINAPDGSPLASLDYGHTATLTLINLGWAMRKEKVETGFLLDLDQGRWQARPGDDDPDDPMSARVKRVIPFVEDRRNTLVFTPSAAESSTSGSDGFMASLEAALKHAVQAVYDIEDVELAVAALPDRKKRTSLLLYEAAEGGAGVLRHLAEEPTALVRVARNALEICHFDPDTGEDRRRAPGALEDCEAACYDCLMSYTNQPDHPVLDRVVLKDYLLALAGGLVQASPSPGARGEYLEQLMNLSQSDLERRWLALVHDREYRLPDAAQKLMDGIGCRPDFLYEHAKVAVWIDGPHHKYPERQERDLHLDDALLLAGWTSIRFDVDDAEGWTEILKRHPSTFRHGCLTVHAIGTLVRARQRDWVVLPGSDDELLLLRPIGGSEDETTGILPALEQVVPAQFEWPDPASAGDHRSARLLRDALRLGFRSSAGPFRSFGSIAVEPRPYQLVPLLMALRLDPVRLLIADDVGIGKTIEAGLIVREMLDNGTVSRFCVLCPPHLAEQWRRELSEKFHLEADLVLSGTARSLERRYCGANESIFDVLPYTIVSTDFIKSDSRRDEFIRTAPELIVVDEAHASAADPNVSGRRHQRHQLLQQLAVSGRDAQDRHVVLVTATPHSGNRGAFRSLIGLLNPDFAGLPEEDRIDERTRRQLATHFVQRRREDIRRDFSGEDDSFPRRFELPEEQGRYSLAGDYQALMRDAIAWAQETVHDESGGSQYQRIRYWSALGLLRSMASSPAAAAATLRSRASAAGADSVEEADSAGRRIVLDQEDTDDEGRVDSAPGADAGEFEGEPVDRKGRRRLLDMAKRADELAGPKSDAKLAHTAKLVRTLLVDGFNPIVFCRFIDTADYVAEHLRSALGNKVRVISVTGRLAAEERERQVNELEDEPARVLVATDCLSEGINLQALFNAVLHYDLPWNPTRLEQRDGRVDRFGQPSPEVRVATIYGTNNGIDEAVLNVLLRKHRQIRDELGVSIPVPGSNDEFVQSVFESLFGSEQLTFDLSGSRAAQLTTDALFRDWDDAAAQESASRTRYAQYAIKTDGVAAEARAARGAIGEATDVARFVRAAIRMLGGTVDDSRPAAVRLNLSEAPTGLRDALFAAGLTVALTVTFDLPARAGSTYLTRTHPFVETLATYVVDGALDPDLGIERTAARCGAIRTDAVSELTTILLVRYRFDVTIRRRGRTDYSQLAEDVALSAFSGLPDSPTWIADDAVEALLGAIPAGNIGDEQRVSFVQRIVDGRPFLTELLNEFADDRAVSLAEQHNRVRSESATRGRATVTAHQPVDVLGAYILLPA